jgi:hypothetical protein
MSAFSIDDNKYTRTGHPGPSPTFFVRIVVDLIETARIIKRFASHIERNAVLTSIGVRLGIVPLEAIALQGDHPLPG